jgi:cation transport ATPase
MVVLQMGIPPTLRLRRAEGFVEVPIELVQIGDLVVIRPGELVPVGGAAEQATFTVEQA